ncbi:haloacid dehalogenase-like hydrolase [Candidatus Vidania fulgoroideorum]
MKNKILTVFDMDKTIIKIDCESTLQKFLYKKKQISKKEFKKFVFFHESYKTNNFDSEKHLMFQDKIIKKRKLSRFKKKIKEFIKKKIKKKIFKPIMKEFTKKRKNSIISTSSNYFWAKQIIETIFKNVPYICTNSSNSKKGFKNSNFGINKYINLKKWMKKENKKKHDIEFFTDSITDLPLILKSKFKILVNPNEEFIKKVKNLKNVRILFIK